MADILVVDCGSGSGIDSILALLEGLQINVVRSVGELQQLSQGVATETPCAILCLARSRDDESRGSVDETLRAVGSKPVPVIDECFDDDYGRLLLQRGALDYLDREGLSSVKLLRRIEWAILRNGHRVPTLPPQRDDDADCDRSEHRRIYEGLPPRQRKVLDLLLQRLPAKQIAERIGVSVKTVHSQLASLRGKFSAASSQDLIILVLRALHEE